MDHKTHINSAELRAITRLGSKGYENRLKVNVFSVAYAIVGPIN